MSAAALKSNSFVASLSGEARGSSDSRIDARRFDGELAERLHQSIGSSASHPQTGSSFGGCSDLSRAKPECKLRLP